ncbi:MAG: DUF11 domain-containing protein [Candidatus Doudnabacteria bacterium]|nr:DUF11 domain-containing protein [Candidatus Doudnabacteria bacterium]
MKFVTKVTQSGIARAMASALVLATIISSTGLIMANWGPDRREVVVSVFNGAPGITNGVANAEVKFVATDSSNPDNGVTVTTNANGEYTVNLMQGEYRIETRHPEYYPDNTNILIVNDAFIDISLLPMTTPPSPTPTPPPTGGNCFPLPPRGQPLLNIWPISESGSECTDLPLLAGKNITDGGSYASNTNINANEGDVLRFRLYVHNGTVDYPDNEAFNVIAKAILPSASGTVRAEAWADNASAISSEQKGGNVNISLGSDEYLEFISGSTKVYANQNGPVEIGGGSDSVVTSGQGLGNMRGCFEFLRQVTFEVRVKKNIPTPTPVPPPPAPTPTPVPPPPAPTPTPVPPPPAPLPTVSFEKLVRNLSDNQTSYSKAVNAEPGEQVEFQLRVTTTETVNNITIDDMLPARLNFVDGSLTIDGSASIGNNLRSITVGTQSNVTKFVRFKANVSQADQFSEGATTLTNIANLFSSVGSRNDYANVVVIKTVPPVTPTIDVQKLVRNVSDNEANFVESTNANFGEQVEFQIKVTSTGTVHNVKIDDDLPSNLTYINNSLRLDGADAGNDINNVIIGSMTSTTKIVTFRATVADEGQFNVGTTTLTNVANLSSSIGSDSDTARVVVTRTSGGGGSSSARLKIEKTVRNVSVNSSSSFTDSVDARRGETVEFRIVVTNTGSRTANNVTLEDILPTNPTFTYESGSLRIDGRSSNEDIFGDEGDLGDIDRGDSVTVIFRSVVPSFSSNTTVTNKATADASNTGSVSDTANVRLITVFGGNVNLVLSKKAYNVTQNRDATTVTARRGDVITYTLVVENTGSSTAQNYVFQDNLADILQLADMNGFAPANFDSAAKTLTWPSVDISGNSKVERSFSVKVKNPIPSGTDYVMTNFFGNEVRVNVERPFVAPPTGTASTLSFVFALATVGGYFFYRRHQFKLINQ